jgi:hypothetical protein
MRPVCAQLRRSGNRVMQRHRGQFADLSHRRVTPRVPAVGHLAGENLLAVARNRLQEPVATRKNALAGGVLLGPQQIGRRKHSTRGRTVDRGTANPCKGRPRCVEIAQLFGDGRARPLEVDPQHRIDLVDRLSEFTLAGYLGALAHLLRQLALDGLESRAALPAHSFKSRVRAVR